MTNFQLSEPWFLWTYVKFPPLRCNLQRIFFSIHQQQWVSNPIQGERIQVKIAWQVNSKEIACAWWIWEVEYLNIDHFSSIIQKKYGVLDTEFG